MNKSLFLALTICLALITAGSTATTYYTINVHCKNGDLNVSGAHLTVYGSLDKHDTAASLFIHERLATGYYQGDTNSSGQCTLKIPQAMYGAEGTMAGSVPIPMNFSVKATSSGKTKWSANYELNAETQTKDVSFNFMGPAVVKNIQFLPFKKSLPAKIK